ncbi:NACHT domain-containing protein [Streptomyces sp. NPDC021056]|uniref:NACHT domain-containing protein n=1 Tax=Streptomyces sp. NPDC021056 TaxID=3155012 RepID=UPI0033D3BBEA
MTRLGQTTSATDAVTLLGLPVALAGLVVSLLGLRSAEDALELSALSVSAIHQDAALAAREVQRLEREQWRQMVGGDVECINVRFALREAEGGARAPAHEGQLLADGSGSVLDIAAFYRGTEPARLVITGSPGGGKSVLASELVLALLEPPRAQDAPVPVRVPLAQWDFRVAPTLEEFLVVHLVGVLRWPAVRVRQLVEAGLVLPVLDGLDEVDASLSQDGRPVVDQQGYPVVDPAAPRARTVLDLLNTYQDAHQHARRGPLVLTCRGTHYDALPESDRLRTSARIHIAHVTPDEAAAYLEGRSSAPSRWRPVLDELRAEPEGVLARGLSTPWRLALAATAYREGDPARLLSFATVTDLNEHLLARYIPAAVHAGHPASAHGEIDFRPYRSADVHCWLHRLTHAATPSRAAGQPPEGGRIHGDLVLHRLWPLAGSLQVRLLDAALTAASVLVLWLPVFLAVRPPTRSLVSVAGLALVLGTVSAAAKVREPHPLRRRGLRSLSALRLAPGALLQDFRAGYAAVWERTSAVMSRVVQVMALAYGCTALAAYEMRLITFPMWVPPSFRPDFLAHLDAGNPVLHVMETIMFGFSYGGIVGALLTATAAIPVAVFWGLFSAVTARVTDSTAKPVTPRGTIREDLIAGCGIALGTGAVAAAGTVVGLGVRGAAGIGWLVFVVALLGVGRNAGRRYAAFTAHNALTQQLPAPLGPFLDWAVTTGLLRRAGPAYQFRHRELQRWLALHPSPPADPGQGAGVTSAG